MQKTSHQIVALVVTFVVGSVLTYAATTKFYAKSTTPVPQGEQDTYQAGWEAAEKKLIENNFVREDGMLTKEFSGKVLAVDSNSITVDNHLRNPLGNKEEKVLITADTEVIYQDVVSEFTPPTENNSEVNDVNIMPESVVNEIILTPADITVGDSVFVTLEDEDSKIAKKIMILPPPPDPFENVNTNQEDQIGLDLNSNQNRLPETKTGGLLNREFLPPEDFDVEVMNPFEEAENLENGTPEIPQEVEPTLEPQDSPENADDTAGLNPFEQTK